jgi:hypothetical protein
MHKDSLGRYPGYPQRSSAVAGCMRLVVMACAGLWACVASSAQDLEPRLARIETVASKGDRVSHDGTEVRIDQAFSHPTMGDLSDAVAMSRRQKEMMSEAAIHLERWMTLGREFVVAALAPPLGDVTGTLPIPTGTQPNPSAVRIPGSVPTVTTPPVVTTALPSSGSLREEDDFADPVEAKPVPTPARPRSVPHAARQGEDIRTAPDPGRTTSRPPRVRASEKSGKSKARQLATTARSDTRPSEEPRTSRPGPRPPAAGNGLRLPSDLAPVKPPA